MPAAISNSLRSCAVARDQHQPDRQPSPEAAATPRTDRRNCRSTYCATAACCSLANLGVRHLGDRRRDDRRRRHHQRVEAGQPPIHRAHAAARARAACRHSRPPTPCTPRSMRTRTFGSISLPRARQALPMDRTSLGLHDAAIGVHRGMSSSSGIGSPVSRTPASASRFSAASKRVPTVSSKSVQRQALRQCRTAGRRAAQARAARTPRPP